MVLGPGPELLEQVRRHAPNGVDHIVDVAFGANIATDVELLALGGSIATYATDVALPHQSTWPSAVFTRPERRRSSPAGMLIRPPA